MILNFLLALLLGAAQKWKSIKWPYAGAAAVGLIKAAIYMVVARNVVVAVAAGLIFFGLGFGIIFFLAKLDQKEEGEEVSYSTPGAKKKGAKTKWEYVPLSILAVLFIFGEAISNMLFLPPNA